MFYNCVFSDRQVTLPLMLDSREQRVWLQKQLISKFNLPVVSFCMNIAGPVKTGPMIERAFTIGLKRITGSLLSARAVVAYKAVRHAVTGPEAMLCVDIDPLELKKITCLIEDFDALGRLFDIDIIRTDGSKVERQEVGKPSRTCIICGNEARICASRRIHSAVELQKRIEEIIRESVVEEDCSVVSSAAVKALLYEVSVTPKPGLVDRNNSGSHSDMDHFSFMSSSSSLIQYFEKAFMLGLSSERSCCFERLRQLGIQAERRMYLATKGINTHKGAVFTMGVAVCAAAICGPEKWDDPKSVLDACAGLVSGIVKSDFQDLSKDQKLTAGQKLFVEHGITGIRGQVEAGLPAVLEHGFPVLEKCLAKGLSYDVSGCAALLAILSSMDDTNMISRGGLEKACIERKTSAEVLEMILNMDDEKSIIRILENMDVRYIGDNLSPGGSADLLSVCFFLHFLKEEKNV